MSPSEFQKQIAQFDVNNYEKVLHRMFDFKLAKLTHYTLGLVTESAEIADVVKKKIRDNKPLDEVNIKEEVSDLLWYCGRILTLLGTSFEEVMQMNVDKLKTRYPDGFSEAAGINRNVAKERKVLEGK